MSELGLALPQLVTLLAEKENKEFDAIASPILIMLKQSFDQNQLNKALLSLEQLRLSLYLLFIQINYFQIFFLLSVLFNCPPFIYDIQSDGQ